MAKYFIEHDRATIQITDEFMQAGASARGGWTHEQLSLLGISWPAKKGWKSSLLGREIDAQHARQFLEIGESRQDPASIGKAELSAQKDGPSLWLYVLELENNNYYVGMTRNVDRRFEQHCAGKGAQWTTLHRPLRILRCADTGLTTDSAASRVEDALTVQMMEQYGRRSVRGGQYCMLDQGEVDAVLVRKGQWDLIERAALGRRSYELQDRWDAALDNILAMALQFYRSPTPDAREDFFAALYRLTQYRFWHSDFDAALDGAFWDEKGILPVLLSFREDRAVVTNCENAFCVLGGALMRTRRNGPPFHHLFLFGWTAFTPSCTAAQELKVEKWRRALPLARDRRYDEFTCILLPKMRYLLRS